ncbi:HEAT repeat domain-containing protein [Maridesulfovibrio sp.]|uniref:HEAT repeat domain-containing protein n=1 Tax=Maridesulfovibrio sp. TaxID=2795000 RepID=UPI002A18DC0A|nr:HEAT repeat domain-containing protein [Maridesulfovibrio sp.]
MSFLRSKVVRAARIKLAFAFVAAYIFEAAALALYLLRGEGSYFIYVALAAHVISAFSFVLFTTAKPRALPGIGFYYPRLAALFTLFMPVLGLVGISVTLFVGKVWMKSHGLAEEYREKSYEGRVVDVDLPTDITEFLYDEVDVHPIADILAGDDVGMKRGAVNLLRRIGSAEAVKLLRKCLSDENSEVRFYAHTALTRLEEDYAESMDKARFRVQRYESASAYAELGSTYRNYSRSGLPERNMQEQAMNFACGSWETAVEKDPENQDYKLRLAECMCESGRYPQAFDIYKETVHFPDLELESLLGICRVFFEQGNFIALYRQVLDMRSKPAPVSSDPFKLGSYNFWLSFFDVEEDEQDELPDDFDTDGVVL